MQANLRLEHELLAVESEHDVHVMVELVAPEAPAQDARAPLAVSLVIDRSGSMAGRKLQVTRGCAAFLAQRLGPGDHLSLVAYDDEVQLLAPLVPVGEHREALLATIGRISSGGSTNLSGGWLKGVETLDGAPEGAARRVVLLSDGLANVGITDRGSLRRMAERALGASGTRTSTIGFGADFDEDLMTEMAEAGGGAAYFAETPDDAPGIFGREFSDLISLVAQNVSVEIRPEAEVRFLGVLNEFPTVPVPGGVQVQLGDAYGRERRRVVFRLHVPGLAALGPHRVAEVVLRYVGVGAEIAHHELRIPVMVNLVSADEAAAASPDAEVTEEVVVLSSAKALEEARELADAGDHEAARRLLERTASELSERARGSSRAAELLDQAGFLRRSAEVMGAMAYDPLERKRIHYRAHETRRGRPRPSP